MLALIVSNDVATSVEVRRVLLRRGKNPAAAPVVSLDRAADRLTECRPDLVVVILAPEPDQALLVLGKLRGLTQALVIVVGPSSDARLVVSALRAGADDYVDESNLLTRLEEALVSLAGDGDSGSGKASASPAASLSQTAEHRQLGASAVPPPSLPDSRALPQLRPQRRAKPGEGDGVLTGETILADEDDQPVSRLHPALSMTPDATALWKALRRRWLLAGCLGIVFATMAALSAWQLVPSTKGKYTARTTLEVAATAPRVMFNTSEVRSDFASYQRKHLALIRSRLVLGVALRQPEVAELEVVRDQADPVFWLEKALKVDFQTAPEVLTISMSGNNSDELLLLVRAVKEAYFQEVVQKEENQRRAHFEELKKLKKSYDEDLKQKLDAFTKLAENAGSDDAQTLKFKHRYAIEQLALAEKELMQLQFKLGEARSELKVQQARDRSRAEQAVSEALVAKTVEKDPGVQPLVAKVAKIEEDIRQTTLLVNPSTVERATQKQRAEVESLRAELAAARLRLTPVVRDQLREQARHDGIANIDLLEARIAILTEHESWLNEVRNRLKLETSNINTSSLNVTSLQGDIARIESTQKTVAAEVEHLSVELRAPSRVRVMEEVTLIPTPEGRKQLLATAGAWVVGFVLVLSAVSLWEFRARRIQSPEEVVDRLGLKVVGTLPQLPNPAQAALGPNASGTPWQALLTESVDLISTMLLQAASTEGLGTIMVTSALPGEGKTSLATQLAASLARTGRRTLLIDADLRRPVIHQLFGVPLEPGFSGLLRGEVEIPDAIQTSQLDRLWLIPAGRRDARASNSLGGEVARNLFQQLRKYFQFIVVDSCPVLAVADTVRIGQHVDAVVFSILRDVSRLPAVHAAQQRLAAFNIRILGAVVNGTVSHSYPDSYSSYYQPQPDS